MFIRTKQGVVDVVSGTVPLNSEHVGQAAEVVEECLLGGQPRIVFDLGGVPLIDSAGLELLLDLRDRCLERGGLVHLAGGSALCRDILDVTGVASEFDFFGDVVEAVGSFAQ